MSRNKKPKPQHPPASNVKIDDKAATAASLITMAGEAIETMAGEELAKIPPEPPAETPPPVEPPADPPEVVRDKNVKPHLRCPCCWEGYGGKAGKRTGWRQVSGAVRKSYYICDQCGARFDAVTRIDVDDGGVEHKTTRIVGVRPPADGTA